MGSALAMIVLAGRALDSGVRKSVRWTILQMIGGTALLAFFIAGAGFLLAGIWLQLELTHGAVFADLWIAAGLMAVASLGVAAMAMAGRSPEPLPQMKVAPVTSASDGATVIQLAVLAAVSGFLAASVVAPSRKPTSQAKPSAEPG